MRIHYFFVAFVTQDIRQKRARGIEAWGNVILS